MKAQKKLGYQVGYIEVSLVGFGMVGHIAVDHIAVVAVGITAVAGCTAAVVDRGYTTLATFHTADMG